MPGGNSNNYEEVFAAWREAATRSAASMSADERRDLIGAQIGAEWPDQVAVVRAGAGFLLQRSGSGDRVPAKWFPPNGGGVSIVVNWLGMEHALAAEEHPQAGWGALYIDVFQSGSAIAVRPPRRHDYLTLHRSDDSNRVQDILSAIAFVANTNPSAIRLDCDARAELWCLAAAAISRAQVKTNVEPGHPSSPNLFVPGLERAGGVARIRLLAEASFTSSTHLGSREDASSKIKND